MFFVCEVPSCCTWPITHTALWEMILICRVQIGPDQTWLHVTQCFVFVVLGTWNTSLCPQTPVQTTTLKRVPTTLTRRWRLRGLQLFCLKPRSSPSSSIQQTELTLGTRSVKALLNLITCNVLMHKMFLSKSLSSHLCLHSTKEPTMTQWLWNTPSMMSSPRATMLQSNFVSSRIAVWCQAGTPSTWSAGLTTTTPARYRGCFPCT